MSKYLVTVSTASRRGRTKLHTFGKLNEAQHLRWFTETHASRKQMAQRRVPGSQLPSPWPPPPRRELGAPYYDELPDGPIRLADGVDVAYEALTMILDAMMSAGRHDVDIDDIKTVVSQQGARITALPGLSDEERQLAESALHSEILESCRAIM
jgi:hypothetical protein